MKGKAEHLARLKRLSSPAAVREITAAVHAAADNIGAEAHRSISAGSVSGKNHVPSAPGEPPNFDSGHLTSNIEATSKKPGYAEVRSEAEYAAALEFGTSKMAARPYMRPARDKLAPKLSKDVAARISKLSRGG